MPVLKTYKNGKWEAVAGAAGHTHKTSDITDFPSSIPANGGNADTLDGKYAEEFASASEVESLKTKVGDASVSEQIAEALSNIQHTNIDSIVQSAVVEELAKYEQLEPAFANSIEECTDINKLYVLPDGYIYAYMTVKDEESVTKIPLFTNKITSSTDTDGSIYNNTGYKINTRGNSSGEIVDFDNPVDNTVFTTGFIPCKQGDVIRLENCYIDLDDNRGYQESGNDIWGIRSGLYNSSKAKVAVFAWGDILSDQTTAVSDWKRSDLKVNEFKIAQSGVSYIRLTLATDGSPADAIVTVNEQIAYETVGNVETLVEWANTGHAFVPADYEDRIIALEDAVYGDLSVYGIVDDENNILMSGTLVKGTYTLKYVADDGTTTELCEFTMK